MHNSIISVPNPQGQSAISGCSPVDFDSEPGLGLQCRSEQRPELKQPIGSRHNSTLNTTHMRDSASTYANERWYVVCVRARRERATAAILSEKGFESFVPQFSTRRAWADRQKVVQVPLFPGYVFCRMEARRRLQVLITPCVFNIISDSRGPIAVSEPEIDAVRRIMISKVRCEPWQFVKVGEVAEIRSGVLEGLRGVVIRVKNDCRLVISVSLLQRSVAVEVDASQVRPVSEDAEECSEDRSLEPVAYEIDRERAGGNFYETS